MRKTNNPHDLAFKELLREKAFAQAFVVQHFTKEELEIIDLNSMELWNANFSGHANEYHSDVVYRVNAKEGTGFIIFLFEHQSTPDKLMAFRCLEYSVFLMAQQLKQGHEKLPVVIPVIFYHGKISPYPHSRSVFDCFENPGLAKQIFLQPFKLVDITIIPDDELKKDIITAPMQIIMKHIRDRDLLPLFADLVQAGLLRQHAKIDGGKMLLRVVNYVIRSGEISSPEKFKELLLTHGNDAEKEIMTIFEQHQRQMKEQFSHGVQQGTYAQSVEIAKKLLGRGFAIEMVAEDTGLSPAEIHSIKSGIEH